MHSIYQPIKRQNKQNNFHLCPFMSLLLWFSASNAVPSGWSDNAKKVMDKLKDAIIATMYKAPLEGLVKILHQLTNEGGTIAIYDDFKEFSIEKIKKTYKQQANLNKLNNQFDEYWPYYETLLRKQNDLSRKRGLTAIDPTLLKECFKKAGFELTLWSDNVEIMVLFNKPG